MNAILACLCAYLIEAAGHMLINVFPKAKWHIVVLAGGLFIAIFLWLYESFQP